MTPPANSPADLPPAHLARAPAAPPAAFACRPDESRGRLFAEPGPEGRTEFQRDRDRIVHSSAFRRLQYKTQVFVYHEGDHYRTRLTHSLEVAQIARSIARALGLNEDLAEALALAHDLGHTPFGHAGEDALRAVMGPFGGFDHNEQTLRILTGLERRYLDFDGLNLTWETLEGVVKHNGPVHTPPPTIAAYDRRHDLWLGTYAGAEAQIAALADDIAYNNHDIDDGLRAGLFVLQDLAEVPLAGPVLAQLLETRGGGDPSRLAHELVRRLINIMVGDLLAETRRRIAEHDPRSADAVRRLGQPLAGFSEAMQANDRALKSFLFEHMYRHYKVNRMSSKARCVVQDLFRLYTAEPGLLPTEWRRQVEGQDNAATARLVADYIAGMTDRFALNEHQRLFDLHARP
jgi:dGTPase